MAIMVAGGMTFAAPGVMPAAHAANANLFVSAENAMFENYFGGPQVIEVVVIDSDINDTDEAKGEPDVTVNGAILRMVQAVDGSWYGYFADREMAQTADTTVPRDGVGLDFGNPNRDVSTSKDVVGVSLSDADGYATPVLVNGEYKLNVLREAKDCNETIPLDDTCGQIGLRNYGTNTEPAYLWPFIQLYDFNETGNVVVQYNKGGGTQTTTLTFDTVDGYAGAELDRDVYPQGAQLHATITDTWLNIDPTDEDSWTFGTLDDDDNDPSTHYQVFDENGNETRGAVADDLTGTLGNLMCDDNCVLLIDRDAQGTDKPVINFQNNSDSRAQGENKNENSNPSINGLPAQSVTITELGPNSGMFGTYDESDESALMISEDAKRRTSATFDYNDTGTTVLVGHDFATIDIQPVDDTWNSGETIPIVITDNDGNKNSRADEDFILSDPATDLIPALETGDPFTLNEGNLKVSLADTTLSSTSSKYHVEVTLDEVRGEAEQDNIRQTMIKDVEKFSDRALIIPSSHTETVDTIIIDFGTNEADFESTFRTPSNDVDAEKVSTILADYAETVKEQLDADDQLTEDQKLDEQLSAEEQETIRNAVGKSNFRGFNFYNQDVSIFGEGPYNIWLLHVHDDSIILDDGTLHEDVYADLIAENVSAQSGLVSIENELAHVLTSLSSIKDTDDVGLAIVKTDGNLELNDDDDNPIPQFPIVADFFSYGFTNQGELGGERVADQIIRLEVEESGDNTSTFEGELEYVMANQLNILDKATYEGMSTIASDPTFIVIEDFTDEDSIRVNYLDLGADGVSTQIADQQEAPTSSGIVSFNADNYKVADTVEIILEDSDLNVDSDLIEIYTLPTRQNLVDRYVDLGLTVAAAQERVTKILTDDKDDEDDPDDDNYNPAALDTVGFHFDVGLNTGNLGRVLDVTFDDATWTTPLDDPATPTNESKWCGTDEFDIDDTGLAATGFTLVETGAGTGVFVGDFQIPTKWCQNGELMSTTGLDIEVNYVDFRDASGEIIEVGDSAGVRANTGSVSLDRTVYPVPFGTPDDFATSNETSPDDRSVFPIHQAGMNMAGTDREDPGLQEGEYISNGDLTIHIRVNDADFDISAAGEDTIGENTADAPVGPVKISVIRGASTVVLGYAGGDESIDGVIDVGDAGIVKIDKDNDDKLVFVVDDPSEDNETVGDDKYPKLDKTDKPVRQFGSIEEIAPDAGIFEADIGIRYTDGPADARCPETETYTVEFSIPAATGTDYCILQGDILQVEYTDPTDASGDKNTVTDSATFDLRNGVLQSDKSVYIIGSDIILTLIEPDFDLDNDQAETYDLDLIEWDSDAATLTLGSDAAFDTEPSDFRETGDSTGIFQIVIETPEALDGDRLERGEEIELEYTDWGPSGSDYVGDEDEDVNLTIFTSNFGATVELDQKVYTWTDKVYITVVAPDHNFDSDLVDEIGNSDLDPVTVSTRSADIDKYKLVETGTDTGIFTGEVTLTGFAHNADGDTTTGDANGNDVLDLESSGDGPTDGMLSSDDDDGITVAFEFSEDETVVSSALIRWNIGEVQWLEASYPATGTGVVRVIDPDMNLDPEAVDNFEVDVWSDSDSGGIDLTVTETNEATGIFEGTVFFTVTDESSGHRLRVAESDSITAEYEDNTLPDPYTTADELDVNATSIIGTTVSPLERAIVENLRVVDAFKNSLDTVSVDQQVQITADLKSGQDKEQDYAYLVQIQDGNGVTVSLSWIEGALSAAQTLSPSQSWTPTEAGSYTATIFVWESIDVPTALSPQATIDITVS